MKHLKSMAQSVAEAGSKFQPGKHDVETLYDAVDIANAAYNALFKLREDIYREIGLKEESGE